MLVDSKILRAKIHSPEAKAAFDALNVLGPRWRCHEQDGEILISTSLEVRRKGSRRSSTIAKDWQTTHDHGVLKLLASLKEEAAEKGAVVLADDGGGAFIYDRGKDTFMPCPD